MYVTFLLLPLYTHTQGGEGRGGKGDTEARDYWWHISKQVLAGPQQ